MEESYGIDVLQEIVVDLVKFGMKAEEAYSDDQKIDKAEAFGLAVSAGGSIFKYIGKGKVIGQQIGDVDGEEREALLQTAVAELDLSHDKVENAIEKGLVMLDSIGDFVDACKEIKE